MRLKFTNLAIERLASTAKAYEVYDTELAGLIFRIEPSGRRSWYFAYRMAGVKKRFRIGAYPGVVCETARREATKLAGKVAANVDPQADLELSRARAERERVRTLRTFLDERYQPWAETHLKTAKEQIARIRSDFAAWMERPLAGLSPFLIENWRREQVKRGKKPVTANRDIQRLRSLVSKAVQWRVIDVHPFGEVKPLRVDKRGRVRYLSPNEERRLRDALIKRETSLREARERFNTWRDRRNYQSLPKLSGEFVDHVRPLTLLALNTGLRRGELLTLTWSDLDLLVKQLTVRGQNAKSAQTRSVPLNAEAMRVLTAWQEVRMSDAPSACIFGHRDGEPMARIDSAWDTVKQLAGLPDFRLHDCRHHFASRLVMAGVPLNTVRDLLGHASIEMTMRYAHLAPETLAEAVEKLTAVG
ncbi:MAG: site-specific integrase [Pseudomonadota bacterium]